MSHSSPSAFSASMASRTIVDRDLRLRLAFVVGVEVLHGALVGLETGELQVLGRVDGLGDLDDRLGARHPAATGAAVDLDQALDLVAVLHGRRREVGDVVQVVHAADRARAVIGQAGEAIDLRGVAHLVGDQHVLDAAAGEHFRLADLLAAHAAASTELLLEQGDVDRLVHLAVHAVAHAGGLGEVAHLPDVPLERVEVEHQARGLDLGLVHADRRGDVEADLEVVGRRRVVPVECLVHVGVLAVRESRAVDPCRRCPR